MAIDDNTSYELTGYQVKDLAQKIRGKADDDVFVGAGTSVAGSRGLVPAPAAGDNTKFLKGDGTWQSIANNYSTTEQNTGTTWINGKPVYKKTVDTGALPNNTSKQISHGISNLDIVVSLSGSAKGGTTQITLPYTDTTANASVGAYVSGDYIRIFSGSNRSDFTTSYVTLYYTKTTD